MELKRYSKAFNDFVEKWGSKAALAIFIAIATLCFYEFGNDLFHREPEMGLAEYIVFLVYSSITILLICYLSAWLLISIISITVFTLCYFILDGSNRNLDALSDLIKNDKSTQKIATGIRFGFFCVFVSPFTLVGSAILLTFGYCILILTELLAREYGVSFNDFAHYLKNNLWLLVLLLPLTLSFLYAISIPEDLYGKTALFLFATGVLVLAPNVLKLLEESIEKTDQILSTVKSIFALLLITSAIILGNLPSSKSEK